ncbi:MAG: alginate export family protein [Prevotella sp.]|nr:alginate export family protein [Prevotella sp.]
MKRHLLTAAIALMAITATAQDNDLSIEAQLRTRGEHNNGALTPRTEGSQAANYISDRARLSFDFKRNDLQLRASVQHAGMWGDDDIRKTNGKATISEAWAKMVFADHFFAQIGRQELSYDDERILGAQDWDMTSFSHDALRLGYEDHQHRLHLILAMNQKQANRGDYYDGAMPYKNMAGLWYHYKAETMPLGVSLLALNLGFERGNEGHGRTNNLQTFGTDITFQPSAWDVHAAFYYQMGKTAIRKVQAYMASGSVGYSFAPELKVSAGYDYMSGNDAGKQDWNAFNALYGSYHNFFGAMDIFGNTLSLGLQDIKGSVASQICDRLHLALNYHYLMTAQQLGNYQKSLGHELDAQLTAKIKEDVTLTLGYSAMLNTETMDQVAGGSHKAWQDWAWIQLNISPSALFLSK